MKKITLYTLSVAFGLFIASSSQSFEKTSYTERKFYDTLHHTLAWEMYRDGIRTQYMQVRDTAPISLHGMSVRFYPNGDTATIMYYNESRATGPYTIINIKGWKEVMGQYDNGAPVGVWRTYYKPEALLLETIYKNGLKQHTTLYYDTLSGMPMYTEEYENERIIKTIVHDETSYRKMKADLDNRFGEELFLANCAMCHSASTNIVGPKLAAVSKRHSAQWLKRWIRSSTTMIKEGDPDIPKRNEQDGYTVMPDFPDLSDQDMDKLIAYLNSL
jgi:hypothetical protein